MLLFVIYNNFVFTALTLLVALCGFGVSPKKDLLKRLFSEHWLTQSDLENVS